MNIPFLTLTVALLCGLAACGGNDAKPPKAPGPPATGHELEKLDAPTAQASPRAQDAAEADRAFAAFTADYVAQHLARNPVQSTYLGDHSHDGSWPDLTPEGEAKDRALLESATKWLATIAPQKLSEQNALDAQILESHLRYATFSLDVLREYDWSPVVYTEAMGSGIDALVFRDFAPVAVRGASLRSRLLGLPGVVAAAKKRLANPPRVHTETAIAQNKGLLHFLASNVASMAKQVPSVEFETALAAARSALEDFQAFLEKDLLRRSHGDFRLGRPKFDAKLRLELDDAVSPEAMVARARALLEETRESMVKTSLAIWPETMKSAPPKAETKREKTALIKRVLDKLAEDHPTNESILAEARSELEKATAFVREHNLVRVPDEPVRVIEMPEHRRGVAIAYCDSSGPLEAKPETLFAISPAPHDWPAKRVDSFYREYNRSMLMELTVHEAMPGHYLQLMHANRQHSVVRAIFQSGSFIEGWAVYAEWVASHHGLGGAKVRLQREKMVLRMCANAIMDHEIHAGSMGEKEALALMIGEAFQEEGEAVAKWKRARLTSAQLTTYLYGFDEMVKMRQAAEARPGFDERAYHDALLSLGSPSPRLIRGRMAK